MEEIKEICLEILKELDRVCKAAGLNYYIYAGTLLGAVRHKGFIPWDDDIDVVMFREDYEKLSDACKKYLNSNEYELQSIISDPLACNAWMKLHKRNTAFISGNRRKGAMEGVNIDIFPVDNAPDNDFVLSVRAKIVNALSAVYRLRYLKHNKKASTKMRIFQRIIMIIPPWNEHRFKVKFDSFLKKYNKKDTKRVVYFSNRKYERKVVPKDCFSSTVMMEFEDNMLPAPGGWREILQICYGEDYMIPPPMSERHSWHDAVILDLQHSWRDYYDQQ